jgi:hypothetical protein
MKDHEEYIEYPVDHLLCFRTKQSEKIFIIPCIPVVLPDFYYFIGLTATSLYQTVDNAS